MSLVCGVGLSLSPAAMTPRTALSELPLTFPVQSPEIAAHCNQVARSEDITSFSPAFVHFLPQVTVAQKMVGFASWADAERDPEVLIDQIAMVTYNPEHWEHRPASEQQSLAVTVRRASEFAHAHDVRFMFAPDRRFAEEYLGEVVPYVDAILLQGQRLQHDPRAFASWVRDMRTIARASSPEVEIYAQVGATRGSASQMLAAIQSLSSDINGVAVWSMPRTLNILQEFVGLLRESSPGMEATPTTTSAPEEMIAETYPSTVLSTLGGQLLQLAQEAQMAAWPRQID